MSEGRSDALTELVRILREQLARKDERIAALEKMLQEAGERASEQQQMLARLLGSTADLPGRLPEKPTPPRPAPAAPVQTAPPVARPAEPASLKQASLPEPPVPPAAPAPERAALPDLAPQIDVIAQAVVSAAARKTETEKAEEEEYEITARFERDALRRGHAAMPGGKRGLLRWLTRK